MKYHHERIDGNGYPEGLKGIKIPFMARIVSVADAFDAMMSNRHYRSKMDLNGAIKQLLGGAGTQFDEEIVSKFINILNNNPEIEKEIIYSYE